MVPRFIKVVDVKSKNFLKGGVGTQVFAEKFDGIRVTTPFLVPSLFDLTMDCVNDSLLVASVELRKVTMALAATFNEHYSLLTTGARGDENVRAFNKAMDLESNLCDAVKAFNNADGMILAAGQDRKKISEGFNNREH